MIHAAAMEIAPFDQHMSNAVYKDYSFELPHRNRFYCDILCNNIYGLRYFDGLIRGTRRTVATLYSVIVL